LTEKVELQKLSRTASIILEDSFRRSILKQAIKKAGSMRQLGKIMGYSSNSPNWSIKQILEGKQGIPLHRLEKLCTFMGLSLADIKKNIKGIK